ncbi:Hypothetical protein AA314_06517 [Archangium gephyra]|uniref:Uncharacterized protein n=1 Tax=Archangium gephyra TaxID=48 RepID=A0AAC8THT7_9BACT|nr:Hypothetical protein AA314_06517 [Archangium gephyra]
MVARLRGLHRPVDRHSLLQEPVDEPIRGHRSALGLVGALHRNDERALLEANIRCACNEGQRHEAQDDQGANAKRFHPCLSSRSGGPARGRRSTFRGRRRSHGGGSALIYGRVAYRKKSRQRTTSERFEGVALCGIPRICIGFQEMTKPPPALRRKGAAGEAVARD